MKSKISIFYLIEEITIYFYFMDKSSVRKMLLPPVIKAEELAKLLEEGKESIKVLDCSLIELPDH